MANKQDSRDYQNVLKTAPNTTVLGVVNTVTPKLLQNIKSKYNPHILLIDESVIIPKKTNLSSCIKELQDIYPHIKTILFTSSDKSAYDELNLYAIISPGSITNVELFKIIEDAPVSVAEQSSTTNLYENEIISSPDGIPNPPKKLKRTKYKYNNSAYRKNFVAVPIFIIVIAIVLIAVASTSNNNTKDKASTIDEAITNVDKTTSTTTKATNTPTTTITTAIITSTKPTKAVEINSAVKSYTEPKPTVAYQPKPVNKGKLETSAPSTAYSPPPTKNKVY